MATQPTSTEQITSTIPEWAKPYAQYLLGNVFGGMGQPGLIGQGYQPYGKQRTAGFSPLQQQAMEGIAGMGVSPELGEAAGLASLAGRRAGEFGQYSPMGNQQFYQDPSFREGQVDFERVGAPSLQQYQMTGPQQVGAERFGSQAMQDYMSPYMSGVVEQQKRGAIQDYARQMPGLQAQGIRAGARGGTREALLQAEANRNLQQQLQGIQATGSQQAFQQAAQQFGADRAAQMQAALANQQAGMQTGQFNLQALLGQQQLGANLGMQAGQLNQAAQLQAQQQRLAQLAQQNQFGLQNAAQRAQYGLSGAQLGEQSRQFGANLGLQGLQQQLAAAGSLGGLGMQGYQQRMGIGQAQLGAGAQGQALEQELLNQQYQDFMNQQQFPYKQAEFGMGLLRGIPATGQTSTLYQQPPSLFGQIAGIGLGLGSLFGGFGGSK
jgi:hypothetical protein